jgi:DNA-binding MarR family transcriptional regulator/N-acetylglutamate synthase-like GNAT family acetyltransferase
MPPDILEDRISAVRQFNRFITQQIGVLGEGLLHTPYSLTEARILYELGHGPAQSGSLTAAWLCRELGLDAGYLSRILEGFKTQGLIEKIRSAADGRQRILHLTPLGKEAFALLDWRSRDEVAEMLGRLSSENQKRLLKAMQTIKKVLDEGKNKPPQSFILRDPEPGDMGWVTHRHGVIYAQEYGWDATFEALVAQIVSDYIKNYNPARERCWIAEMDGEIVGSVFIVQLDQDTAKLRLLLVEAKARGLGLGTRLVEECIRFARRSGYKKLTLWTNSVLVAARHIYQQTGFKIVDQEENHSFGKDLVSETWELDLSNGGTH